MIAVQAVRVGTAHRPDEAEAEPSLINQAFAAQRITAQRWRSSTARERMARIQALRRAILDHRVELYKAFWLDFHKPALEVDATELIPTLEEIAQALSHLRHWMHPLKVSATLLTLGTRAWIEYQPKGRCLIVAPWNYPLQLLFVPLVSALAAGNTVMLKPSELAPRVSEVLGRIIASAFAVDEVVLFQGGQRTAEVLLDLPFDHIFFTGSPNVGKCVMAAAARHLSSVTLELGGKSPTIVDASADLVKAARTIMWAKCLNSGQTCVAPDHVYVHASVKDRFVAACEEALRLRYGETAGQRQSSADLTRMINVRHTRRVATLLRDAVAGGARVLLGGQVDLEGRYVSPTLIEGAAHDAALMVEEIFGPVLPVIAYSDVNEVIRAINAQPKPLALYVWSRRQATIDTVLAQTSSGGVCVNHCMVQVAHAHLPFGGVNHSGQGSAHGYFGFRAFSHERAVLRAGWFDAIPLFFPPYTAWRRRGVGLIAAWVGRSSSWARTAGTAQEHSSASER